MILSYFDSSIVLAILLEEKRKKEAFDYWQNSSIRISSILLRIETVVSLRRTYEYYKNKFDDTWLIEKSRILDEYLDEVNYRIVGPKIEREIYLKKELSKCRSLDAIHIATALKFREMANADVIIYTFDQTMHELAKHYRFKTNKL
jgi:predicted nucleic acid-binding protein